MKKCYSDFYCGHFPYVKMLIYGDKNKSFRGACGLNVCSPNMSKKDGFKGILRVKNFIRA
jgi:hypothetical protein